MLAAGTRPKAKDAISAACRTCARRRFGEGGGVFPSGGCVDGVLSAPLRSAQCACSRCVGGVGRRRCPEADGRCRAGQWWSGWIWSSSSAASSAVINCCGVAGVPALKSTKQRATPGRMHAQPRAGRSVLKRSDGGRRHVDMAHMPGQREEGATQRRFTSTRGGSTLHVIRPFESPAGPLRRDEDRTR